ncbi:MAG: flavodoxin family protein [Myxococcota bacterium]
MKVVAFNGSPREEGNTVHLLSMLAAGLREQGVEMERVDICQGRPRGCIACGTCSKRKNRKCALEDDRLNDWLAKMWDADGVVLAAPTYFANVPAEMKALIDRSGYVARANGGLLRRKVGAAVVAMRRAGGVPAFDAMNHMFLINQMVVVGSTYWNLGLGRGPGEVEDDDEGAANMVDLAENMAWVMRRLRG